MGASGSSGFGATELAARLGRLQSNIRGTDQGVCITLTREVGMKLGLMVNILLDSGLLLISEVQAGGLVEEWNLAHSEQEQVRRGDWIISVNGVSGTPGSMFGQLQQIGNVELVVSRKRPVQTPRRQLSSQGRSSPKGVQIKESMRFPITVEIPENQTLGVEISISSRGVEIVNIPDGVMKEWNAKNPSKEVRVGDRIVFANGTGRHDMIGKLWKSGTLHMVVRRGLDSEEGEVLSKSFADQLPVVTFADHDAHCGGDACGICLEEWAPGSQAIELPCKHRYHKDCAVPWLTKHSALCPLCGWAADHNRGGCGGVAVDRIPPIVDDFDDLGVQAAPRTLRPLLPSTIAGAMQAVSTRHLCE